MKPSLKVMIVDDDSIALTVAAAVLEDRGYTVVQRDSALGTMLAIRREKPDVLVLDVHMPGLTGDALSKLIVEGKGGHQPVIILHSTTEANELEQLVKSCAANGAIEKTADPRTFLERFEKLVSQAMGERGMRDSMSSSRTK